MPKSRSITLKKNLRLFLYAILFLLLLHFVYFSIQAAQRTSHSFVVLYTSSQLIREGGSFSRFYNDRWFGRQTARFDVLYRDIYKPHSPITALMLLPLSDLDYAKARVMWTLFNVVLFAAGSFRLLRALKVKGMMLPIMISLMLLYDPLYVNLGLGQSYILMFVLSVIAWIGYRRGDNRALGLALGVMLALKTAGVFLWLLLILQRRWSALAWGIAIVLLFALASLPYARLNGWMTYFREVGYFNGQPFTVISAYQTPTSLFGHLFTYDADWNPAPIVEMPIMAALLTWGSLALLVGTSLVVGIQRGVRHQQTRDDLTFASFMIVSVLIVPLALDYHYMLLMLPVMILVAQKGYSRRAMLVLIVGVALIAIPINYRQPALAIGLWALLAYPKLYGALLLWGLAIWQIQQRSPIRLTPFAILHRIKEVAAKTS